MADEKRVEELEIILRYIQERKVSYLKRQKFEFSGIWRDEENRIFKELEELCGAEHLKTVWKVINDGQGHYTPYKQQ